jgi:DNA (cytosine-5)-methyltransferase 1
MTPGSSKPTRQNLRRKKGVAAVDLFCGVGGLTHGMHRGGVDVVAGLDVDPACRFPYEANSPATFLQMDVRDVTGEFLQSLWRRNSYSLLAGCAPCQPFSTYSQKGRATRRDSKWSLIAEFARLIREANPDFVTMENVPQLLTHRVVDEFMASLASYQVWHGILDCAEYGIPQTRKRFVLLASRVGPIQLLPAGRFDCSVRHVRNAIFHLPPLAAGQSDTQDPLHCACSLSRLNMRRIRASLPGGTWRDWDRSLLAPCHRKRSGETYPSVYGRMEWDAPAPTITTQCFGYGNGRFGHPEQDRAISLREAAILQTFPESYRFVKDGEPVRFNVLGRLIGNAVPVRLGEVVAKSVLAHVTQSWVA